MSTTGQDHFSQGATVYCGAVVVALVPAGMYWRIAAKRISRGQEGSS